MFSGTPPRLPRHHTGKEHVMTVIAIEHVTLDGVMQAPARPDEDTRGGFSRGGWSLPYGDQVMADVMSQGMASGAGGDGALLLGRRTYTDFAAVWPPRAGNPVTEHLNKTQKYVVSRTLREPLPWQNSVLLTDAETQVAELKQRQDLAIIGSGALVRSLMRAGLIDEFLLTIHPLVLGQGQRLFPETGPDAALTLVDARPTTTGVIIATYRRAG
jgi:dihydrofolate reductase